MPASHQHHARHAGLDEPLAGTSHRTIYTCRRFQQCVHQGVGLENSLFIGVWASLRPWSRVRSLLCVCYIPYASCKAWVRVIPCVSSAAFPLKRRSEWTARNQHTIGLLQGEQALHFSIWLLQALPQHHGAFLWRNSSAGEGHLRGIHPTSPSRDRTLKEGWAFTQALRSSCCVSRTAIVCYSIQMYVALKSPMPFV